MRKLTFTIFRHDPRDPESKPHFDTFIVDEVPRMTIYMALDHIQNEMDPSLFYDVVCRSNVCGSCAISINGQPKLACRTQISDLPDKIRLTPLSYFPLIKDLSTDKGRFFMELNRRLEAYIHTNKTFDPDLESLVDDAEAFEVYETDRCIECGICYQACGSAMRDPEFLGAAGINKVLHFVIDSRDNRDLGDLLYLVEGEDGVFGCEAMLGCRDFCPKDIALPDVIARLRNRVAKKVLIDSIRGVFTRSR